MTVPLSAGSGRLVAARRFGDELDKAMRTRKVGAKRLGPAAGVAVSAIGNWRAGLNLPTLGTAVRLVEALDWKALASIVRDARSQPCARCGTVFLNEGGTPKRFCSLGCRLVDAQLRKPTPGHHLAGAVRDELAKVHGTTGTVSRKVLRSALAEYNRSAAKGRLRVDQQGRQLGDHRVAVEAMCRQCEPEGRCRDAGCPLRPVSPLPLVRAGERDVATVGPAEGLHGPTHRPGWLVAVREANARRWSRPGERERFGDTTRRRVASETPDQRAQRAAAISVGRRRGAA